MIDSDFNDTFSPILMEIIAGINYYGAPVTSFQPT